MMATSTYTEIAIQIWVLTAVSEIPKNQCDGKKVAFFFKQWGGWGADGKKQAKKHNGRLLDGRTWDAVPVPPPHLLIVSREDAKSRRKDMAYGR
ncbi:MAG: DUF5131 family protein [Desulfosarcina sp.]|nr:DUF5131 family protein [Desulfosarcina sp.]MBC2766093.1 DUF5131 family protein [Desulfosarcina sp.]